MSDENQEAKNQALAILSCLKEDIVPSHEHRSQALAAHMSELAALLRTLGYSYSDSGNGSYEVTWRVRDYDLQVRFVSYLDALKGPGTVSFEDLDLKLNPISGRLYHVDKDDEIDGTVWLARVVERRFKAQWSKSPTQSAKTLANMAVLDEENISPYGT